MARINHAVWAPMAAAGAFAQLYFAKTHQLMPTCLRCTPQITEFRDDSNHVTHSTPHKSMNAATTSGMCQLSVVKNRIIHWFDPIMALSWTGSRDSSNAVYRA